MNWKDVPVTKPEVVEFYEARPLRLNEISTTMIVAQKNISS